MAKEKLSLSDLEERFLPPSDWQENFFTNSETNHNIRYCHLPAKQSANGNIVILPGLSEFCEKYIELAFFFTQQNFNIYIIDWAYQGKSNRWSDNRQKRHSDGYKTDLSDLDYLIQHELPKDMPLYMLAHSMGGHIGLRYIAQNPNVFSAASISAPMLGIKDFQYIKPIVKILLHLLSPFKTSYVPFGKDWNEKERTSPAKDIFSSDPIRKKLHNFWSTHDTELQVGNPTLAWVDESIQSIDTFFDEELPEIKIPCITFVAGQEKIVDNKEILIASRINQKIQLIDLPTAKHEIFMETDKIWNEVTSKTLQLFTASA